MPRIYRQVEARPRVSVRGHETCTGGWVNSNAVGTPRETSAPAPHACVRVCARIRAVDVRRGARWGDLLTQFVENMTQPRLAPSRYVHRAPSPSPAARVSLRLSTLALSLLLVHPSFLSPPRRLFLHPSLSLSLFLADPVLILIPPRAFRLPPPMCVRLSFASSPFALPLPRSTPSSVFLPRTGVLYLQRGKPRCLFLSFQPVPPPPPVPSRRAHSHFLSSSHAPPHSSPLPRPTHLFTRRLSRSFPYE